MPTGAAVRTYNIMLAENRRVGAGLDRSRCDRRWIVSDAGAISNIVLRLVREVDHDRYLATLFAPAGLRDALFALYAFSARDLRMRELAREPMPGEIRLQWWREVLMGERAGEAAAHPVAAARSWTRCRAMVWRASALLH